MKHDDGQMADDVQIHPTKIKMEKLIKSVHTKLQSQEGQTPLGVLLILLPPLKE